MRTMILAGCLVAGGILLAIAHEEPTPAKPTTAEATSPTSPSEADTAATTTTTTVTLCRIYKAMTMGNSVCCFYCLPCPGCTSPTGHLFSCDKPTGGCDCMHPHCEAVEVRIGPKGEEKIYSGAIPPDVKAKLDEIPSVLLDTAITTNVKKHIIKLDPTDDGMDNPVLVYMAAGKIKPKKPGGGHYPHKHLAFAREIVETTGVDHHPDPATDVEPIEGYPRLYSFAWNGYEGVAFVDDP